MMSRFGALIHALRRTAVFCTVIPSPEVGAPPGHQRSGVRSRSQELLDIVRQCWVFLRESSDERVGCLAVQ